MDQQTQQALSQLGSLTFTPIGISLLGRAGKKIMRNRRLAQEAREREQQQQQDPESQKSPEQEDPTEDPATSQDDPVQQTGGDPSEAADAPEEEVPEADAAPAEAAEAGEAGEAGEATGLLEAAGEAEVIGGGPEDPLADVAAGVLALGAGIASIFGAPKAKKPAPPPPPPKPPVISQQLGISAAEV